jgi:protoporphyrinogen oxidase
MRILVVGAGLSGLTVASQLCHDHEVIVLEKEAEVGGLTRSFRYGSSTFDIGPHYFTAHETHVESHFMSMFPDPRGPAFTWI